MKCCLCQNSISPFEKYNEALGMQSHIKCDEAYFEKQEKLINYHKVNLIDVEGM